MHFIERCRIQTFCALSKMHGYWLVVINNKIQKNKLGKREYELEHYVFKFWLYAEKIDLYYIIYMSWATGYFRQDDCLVILRKYRLILVP